MIVPPTIAAPPFIAWPAGTADSSRQLEAPVERDAWRADRF
jgi:hypothetical protein